MGRNYFDAYCKPCQKGFVILIGNPTQCPDCMEHVRVESVSSASDVEGKVPARGKETEAIPIKR